MPLDFPLRLTLQAVSRPSSGRLPLNAVSTAELFGVQFLRERNRTAYGLHARVVCRKIRNIRRFFDIAPPVIEITLMCNKPICRQRIGVLGDDTEWINNLQFQNRIS